MKKIYIYLVLMFTLLFTSSCSTFGQIYYDDYDGGVSYSVVVSEGVPYYVDNVLSYYYYRGMYYYPYMYNNRWFVHPFDKPQPRGFIYHPNMRGNRFDRGRVQRFNGGGIGRQPQNGGMRGGFNRQETQNRGMRGTTPRVSSTRPQYNGIQMRQGNSQPSMRSGISIGGNRGGGHGRR